MHALAPDWLLGCRLRACWFEPTFHKHAGKLCQGIQIHVDDAHYQHAWFRPWRLQSLAFKALRQVQPDYPLWRDFAYEYEHQRLAIDLINGSPLLREWVDDPAATPADLDALTRADEDSGKTRARPSCSTDAGRWRTARYAAARRIAHLDMDAFYASVELLRYPELRGLPVVIGGSRAQQPLLLADGERRFARLRDYAGRGVITTATYEARALGVFSAMGIMKAARLAPEAILLPVDFAAYRHYSRLFKAAVAQLAPADRRPRHRRNLHRPERARRRHAALAQRIKDAVRAATGLSCSICVAANKLLAKIGSDLDKPDGLTLLNAADLTQRIWPLPARKINGIGPKASERLARWASTASANWRKPTPLSCSSTSAAATAAGCSPPRTASTNDR
jgi:hypothetical protein